MNSSDKTVEVEYASYNVLARKALIFGVPVIALVIFLFLILASTAAGVAYFDNFLVGLIVPLILLALLFSIRIACLDDSRALEGAWWSFKGALSRIRCRSTITSFTSKGVSKKEQRDKINEFFKLIGN